jgi:hypothetical protein
MLTAGGINSHVRPKRFLVMTLIVVICKKLAKVLLTANYSTHCRIRAATGVLNPSPTTFYLNPNPTTFHLYPNPTTFHLYPNPTTVHLNPNPTTFHLYPNPTTFHLNPNPTTFYLNPTTFHLLTILIISHTSLCYTGTLYTCHCPLPWPHHVQRVQLRDLIILFFLRNVNQI